MSATTGPDTHAEFQWHYGPTEVNPNPALIWHTGCGGEVYVFTEGYACSKCDANGDHGEYTP